MSGFLHRPLAPAQGEAAARWMSETRPGEDVDIVPPVPDPLCLHGLIGEIAAEGSDGTETNPFAIAGNVLAYLSCAIGRGVYLPVGNTSHHPRLFFLHVGRSGRGRKGDALSLVLRIDEAIRAMGEGLAPHVHRGGLSSREGLAALVHDGYRHGQIEIPAVEDKRLWVVESEFANVLQQSRRGGNTLSAALRDCWDGVDLKPATKTNRVHATAPHVCISAAISPSELLGLVQQRDLFNGFGNRFLLVWAERFAIQPFPKRTSEGRLMELANRVAQVLRFVRDICLPGGPPVAMELSPDARRRYGELYRSELSQEFGTVVLDSLLERRAPMLLRIAMLLAVIDQQWRIDERHIEAGMAWIRYGISSVRFVFAGESKHPISLRVRWAADRISAFLAVRGNASRRDLMIDCFQRHQPASIIDAALAYLIDSAPQRIRVEVRPRAHDGPGRPGTIYHWV